MLTKYWCRNYYPLTEIKKFTGVGAPPLVYKAAEVEAEIERLTQANIKDIEGFQDLLTDRDMKIMQVEQHLAQAQQELDEYKSWQHCEECNFPLQDQGLERGMVCLLCGTKERLAQAQRRIAEMFVDITRMEEEKAIVIQQLINAQTELEIYKLGSRGFP